MWVELKTKSEIILIKQSDIYQVKINKDSCTIVTAKNDWIKTEYTISEIKDILNESSKANTLD